jgi:hypothetical protein
MRISISHDKGQKEAMRIVDESANELVGGISGSGITVSDTKKEWDGNVMNFSFRAGKSIFHVQLHGTVEVTEKEVIVTAEIPQMVKGFVSEDTVKAAIEKKVKGMLTA